MLEGLNFVLVQVPDAQAAREFYADKLGLQVEEHKGGFVQFQPRDGGAIFALEETPGAVPVQSVELWWQVDDTDRLYNTLQAQGVEIVSPPRDEPFGRALEVKDPAGHTVHMYQPRPHG
ncbi:MAG TPA: VOC family protein [Chloroflexia bacterium]|nr:VOC family protein [Chloroflexia bacterium]